MKQGIVVRHTDEICLQAIEFKVSEAGRQRVLKEKAKNVHAFVLGYERPMIPEGVFETVPVTYNPYKFDSFVRADTFEPVHNARFVIIQGKKLSVVL